ncbi:hypothetical protein DPMN_109638 [Dreissena polymorpha]|uniref:Uncharacterized protein n=1 Tax=Dreissena polymorpha TaxID=45954 RepID=A0A9D4KB18_DREPO|nr:hypothetical protein DPMN_109638 [Dreissena polymorpha]
MQCFADAKQSKLSKGVATDKGVIEAFINIPSITGKVPFKSVATENRGLRGRKSTKALGGTVALLENRGPLQRAIVLDVANAGPAGNEYFEANKRLQCLAYVRRQNELAEKGKITRAIGGAEKITTHKDVIQPGSHRQDLLIQVNEVLSCMVTLYAWVIGATIMRLDR